MSAISTPTNPPARTPRRPRVLRVAGSRADQVVGRRPDFLALVALSLISTALLALIAPSLFGASSVHGASNSALNASGPAPLVEGHLLKYRWLYLSTNFQVAANVDTAKKVLSRAKTAGYNGVVVSDGKLGRLDDGSLIPAYYTNLRAFLDHAKTLEMTVLPATADFGYSSSLLWHNPNLAEALPVRDAPFRAVRQSGRLVLAPDETARQAGAPPVRMANGDFEALPASGDQFPGWTFQDAPGKATFVDRAVVHGGKASLRMVDLAKNNPTAGNGRVYQKLAVEPFQVYHVSVWYKTKDFSGGEVRVLALGQNPNRTLQWNAIDVLPNADWTRYDVTFNTLTHREVNLYLGVWGGGTGTIWWDDGLIELAGPVNVVRRPGAPVRVTTADGMAQLEEGRDFDRIEDPKMGVVPWPGSYDLWHTPPAIGVPSASRIREGDGVRVSFYEVPTIYGEQVGASLTEPEVFDIVRGQMTSIRREFAKAGMFGGWMFNHDEIRVHGWDDAPRAGAHGAPPGSADATGLPGDDLAYNFRRLYGIGREADPSATIVTWSDMFDPHHNADPQNDPYYLVNGGWSGSWEGLAPDVLILNWNSGKSVRRASAEFFSGRGHAQILAGYYDAHPGTWQDRDWLKDLAGLPGIEGVMYTQWGSGYGNLEDWAEYVWGGAPWVEATPDARPTATGTAATTAVPTPIPTVRPTGTATAGPVPVTATPSDPPLSPAILPWLGKVFLRQGSVTIARDWPR